MVDTYLSMSCPDCGNQAARESRPTAFRSVVWYLGVRRYRCSECTRRFWKVGFRRPEPVPVKRARKARQPGGPGVSPNTPPG